MLSSITTIHAFTVILLVRGLVATTTTAESPSVKPLPSDGIIAKPGCYQLQQDLIVERDTGITVAADDVTIDLGGHALRFRAEPRKETYGILADGRKNLTITNGSITGFWFNIHCVENQGLRIDHVRFDDIPYIAINVAGSKNVLINDNTFTHFRYDVPRPDKDRYLIGINIGAEDAVITHNQFDVKYTGNEANGPDFETVLVLFSADVSQHCVVTHNQMVANTILNRSYGIWIGSNAHVSATHNTIRNMKYGLCLDSNATGLAGFNHFSADPPPAGVPATETYGIYADLAKKILFADNEFQGITIRAIPREEVPVKR